MHANERRESGMDKWGAYDTIRGEGNVCGVWLNGRRHVSMASDWAATTVANEFAL